MSAAETTLGLPSAPAIMIASARVGLALAAIHQDNIPVVEEQYVNLMPLRGMMLNWVNLASDRILGLCATAMGQPEQAAAHFEDALAFCRKAGYRPELAWSLCDYADMLLERDKDGDRQKAMQLLDESLQISTELGMRPLMERVLSRREILKA